MCITKKRHKHTSRSSRHYYLNIPRIFPKKYVLILQNNATKFSYF